MREILEQVPPDYYDVGTRRNLFQRIWHGRKWRVLQELLSRESPTEILDVGCAGGLTTSHLALWFPKARVTGLDTYDQAVIYGREHHAEVSFVLGDGHALPFASKRFDVVTCVETLEHLRDPTKAIAELRRCLRSEGLLIVGQDTDSLLFRVVWWLWTKSRGQVWDHAHVSAVDSSGLQAMLEDEGFRIVSKQFVFFGMEIFLKAHKAG